MHLILGTLVQQLLLVSRTISTRLGHVLVLGMDPQRLNAD